MKLENQVCSLVLAKRLEELGMPQESLFYWQQHYIEGRKGESMSAFKIAKEQTKSVKGAICFSAFTVAELGIILPLLTNSWQDKAGDWICQGAINGSTHADSEADARAKMLIYLIENKLVEWGSLRTV